MTRRLAVAAATDARDHKLMCNRCGELRSPRGGPLDQHARRHAADHPDHEVWMTWVVMKSYFVRTRAAS